MMSRTIDVLLISVPFPNSLKKLLPRNYRFRFSQVISSNQHGFVKGRSVQTKILEVATKTFHGSQTDVIYTYFSKASDRVNHNLLLKD